MAPSEDRRGGALSQLKSPESALWAFWPLSSTREEGKSKLSCKYLLGRAKAGYRWLLFDYFTPYVRRCTKGAVRPQELPNLWKADNCKHWAFEFDEAMRKEEEQCREKRQKLVEKNAANGDITRAAALPAAHVSVVSALLRVFWKPFVAVVAVRALIGAGELGATVLLQKFLEFQEVESENLTKTVLLEGLVVAIGIALIQVSSIFVGSQFEFWLGRIAIRIETCMVSALFNGVIREGGGGMAADEDEMQRTAAKAPGKGTADANMYTLLTVDIPSVGFFLRSLLDIFLLPMQICFSGLVLYKLVGKAAWPGLWTLTCFCTVVFCLELFSAWLKVRYLKKRDTRLERVFEVLGQIRSIRLAGWEDVAEQHIDKYREKEMKFLSGRVVTDQVASAISSSTAAATEMAIFIAYTVGGLALVTSGTNEFSFRPSVAISTIYLFNKLIGPVTSFPWVVNSIVEGVISLKRFESFLSKPLQQHPANAFVESTKNGHHGVEEDGESQPLLTWRRPGSANSNLLPPRHKADGLEVAISDMTYTWGKKHRNGGGPDVERFELTADSLEVGSNECVVVLGGRASGKSSLIRALMGNMKMAASHVNAFHWVKSRMTGAPIGLHLAEVWIPSASVRDAITFGRPFVAERYDRVVKCCQLLEDFAQWADGDLRFVDQGGHALSGGQRARVALARALYGYTANYDEPSFDALSNLFLLDDPFASLDPDVGRNVFWSLFGEGGILRGGSTVVAMQEDNFRSFMSGGGFSVPSSGNVVDDRLGVKLTVARLERGKLAWSGASMTTTVDDDAAVNSAAGESQSGRSTKPAVPLLDLKVVSGEEASPAASGSALVVEEVAAGAVGMTSYRWYLRSVGVALAAIVLMWIVIGGFSDVGSEMITAQWTGLPRLSERLGAMAADAKNAKTSSAFVATAPSIEGAAQEKEALSLHEVDKQSKSSKFFSKLIGIDNLVYAGGHVIYLGYFCLVSVTLITSTILTYSFEAVGLIRAARGLHRRLVRNILNAPILFFDFSSLGRLINRFSADMQVVDDGVLMLFGRLCGVLLSGIFTVTLVLYVQPILLPVIPILVIIIYGWVFRYFRAACREMQRSRLLALTPLSGRLNEALHGSTVIHAFGAVDRYREGNIEDVHGLMKTHFMQTGTYRWAGTRLQLAMFPFALFITVLPVFMHLMGWSNLISYAWLDIRTGREHAGLRGVVLNYVLTLPTVIGSIMWEFSFLEQRMCSVERIHHYVAGTTRQPSELLEEESEKFKEAEKECLPPKPAIPEEQVCVERYLPAHTSGLTFRGVEVSYPRMAAQRSENLMPFCVGKLGAFEADVHGGLGGQKMITAISDLTADIRPGEHIGIVGRTGAGKSSMLLAITGLLKPTKGDVLLDGVPLEELPRAVLRTCIGVLPQSPLFLDGCELRRYLDPMNSCEDEAVWDVLERTQSVAMVKAVAGKAGLDFLLTKQQGQAQFTVDELRQLSMARLLLHAKKYRLILVDEPPVSDSDAEQASARLSHATRLINLLRKSNPLCSVVVVAHHVVSIEACTRIWVMRQGRLAKEEGTRMLTDQQSLADLLVSVNQIVDDV